jgi:hypothetical protein
LANPKLFSDKYQDLADGHYLSKRVGTPVVRQAAGAGLDNQKYPTYYINNKNGVIGDLAENEMRNVFVKVHDNRKASRNANLKKPDQKPELAPPGQDFVATMVIPNAGTFSVSTAEEASPISTYIKDNIATKTPKLWAALKGKLPAGPLHIEIVVLFRVEERISTLPQDIQEILEHTGQYPTETRLQVYGKYRPTDTQESKPAC